jgi:hypothetical protein
MRRALAVIVAGVATFAVLTLAALEGGEVVIVETIAPDGAPRRTRTWIADEAGNAWVEAANPERPFLQDLRRQGTVILERAGGRRACDAEIAPNPDGHARIRRLLAARDGWADRWIGILADTHASLAVRLTCA